MQYLIKWKSRLRWPRAHSGHAGIEFLLSITSALLLYLLGLPAYDLLTNQSPQHLLAEHLVQEVLLSENLAQDVSLVEHLEYARHEAIRLEAVITVCPTQDGKNCLVGGDWHQGWIIFTDDAKPAHHLSIGDKLLHRQHGYAGEQPMVMAMDLIQYQADGSIYLD